MSNRRTIFELEAHRSRAASASRRSSRRPIARSFDFGEPIRLESSTPPAVAPHTTLIPRSAARSLAVTRSNVWNEALRHLPESPYPFSVADYDASPSTSTGGLESAVHPDDPDAPTAKAAALSVEECGRVDNPDAPAIFLAPVQVSASPTQKQTTATTQSHRPAARATATADWDVASDEAFERTLQDAQRRAAAPAPSSRAAPPAPTPQALATSGHDVFDRMASAMQHATAFDLGRHEVDDRFDAFENELRNPPRPVAHAAPKPDPAVEAAFSIDDTDIVGQLAMMEADTPASPHAAPPAAPPVTPPPSEAQP